MLNKDYGSDTDLLTSTDETGTLCSISAPAGVPCQGVLSYRQVCHVKGYRPIVRCAMSKGTVLSSGVPCQRALSYRQVCHVKGHCPIVRCAMSKGTVLSSGVPCQRVLSYRQCVMSKGTVLLSGVPCQRVPSYRQCAMSKPSVRSRHEKFYASMRERFRAGSPSGLKVPLVW